MPTETAVVTPANETITAGAGDKITVYLMSEMMGHIIRIEAKLISHGRQKWAQYPSAPFIRFTAKGKRKPGGWQGGYRPYCLVLRGWDHPEPASMFGPASVTETGCFVSKARHRSFGSGWVADFEAMMAERFPGGMPILVDYRESSPDRPGV